MKELFNKSYKSIFSILGIGFLFWLVSCASTEKLQVIDQNFGEQIKLQQNLTFTFNQAIAKPEQLDVWQEVEYLDINPKVKGKFKWTSPTMLIFSPDEGFSPNTKYQVKLTQNLIAELTQKKVQVDKEKTFEFHTPYLDLSTAQAYWSTDANGSPELLLNLLFNYDINPSALNSLLSISTLGKSETGNGTAANYSLKSNEAGKNIRLVVKPTTSNSKELAGKTISIKIKEGLKMTKGDGTAPQMSFKTDIPDPQIFEITQVSSYKMTGKTIVSVLTNQSVMQNEAQIKDLISVTPQLRTEIEKTDAGFLIKADFKDETNYQLTINQDLKGVFGRKLTAEYQHVLLFGGAQKTISFVDGKASYLTSKGERNVGINIYGFEKVELEVYKIYENNIQHFLREIVGLYDYSDMDSYFYGNDEKNYGDVILKKEMKITDFKKAGSSYAIDMREIVATDNSSFEGIYYVVVRSHDDRWIKDRQIVCVSDLGFIVRRSDDEIFVFANSIMNATPEEGTQMKLISTSNQTIQTTKTDENGIAKFTGLKKLGEKYNFQFITAQKNDDYSYIHLSQNEVSTYGFETDGIYPTAGNYQSFIYPERNLYRPDEKISFKAIIRNWEDWKSVGQIPVKWKVIMPNGRSLVEKQNRLSEEGTFEATIPLPSTSVTGSYTIEVYTSNDVLLASRNINVEEFMPQRIKVESTTNEKFVKSGQSINLDATATNLFGPPAAERNYEVRLTYNKKSFQSKDAKYQDYNFFLNIGNNQMPSYEDYENTGETDSEGKIAESVKIPSTFKNIGLMQGTFYTTVFDETGRPVGSRKSFDIITQPYFLGVKGLDYYWIGLNQPLNFPLIALDYDGKAIPANAKVQVVRYDWHTVLEKRYNGQYTYVSKYKEVIEYDKEMKINPSGTSINFTPKISARYEVRVSLPNAETYVATNFYAYYYGSASNSSFQVDKAGQIDITLNKKKYNAGETAKVLFKAPFSGRMLVTLEKNSVLTHKYIDVKNRSASMDIPITDEHLPNVYVSATLIRPLSNNDVPLTVAHGYIPISVENEKEHKIELEITAPERIRSSKKQNIIVKTGKPMQDVEITIAAVDEGILLIKNFQTPAPYNYFFQKRALGVKAFDMYQRLYPEFKANIQNFGAGGYDLGNRTNPMANKRVKPVSFWSGTLKTNSKGEVNYEIDVPQFSGDLRIMAVAVQGSKFGSATANMKVADPIVVSTGLPRFLSPKDKITVPVTMSNTTEKVAQATVILKTKGAVSPDGITTQTVTIQPNSEAKVNFKINAIEAVGTAEIDVEVAALGEKFNQTTDITVRPFTSLLKESDAGSIEGGQSKVFSFKHGYVPTSADAKLVVSKSPMIQFVKSLDYLVRYPYGCVEQTTSSAFPQLYVKDISESMGKALSYNLKPEENIRFAIAKLQSMQLYEGGLSYWQGGHSASWWGTVYATHFLMEAKKAGYEVNDNVLNKAYDYLMTKIKSKDTERLYYYNVNNQLTSRPIANKSIFYSMYILASAGKQDVATMNYYKANKHLLAIDSRYLLASTYKLLGDKASYDAVLPSSFSGEKSEQSLGGNFYSYIRDQAIALNVLLEQDPKNPQIGTLAKQLSEQYRAKKYLNTQEHAFTFLALGKLARKANNSNITAQISAGGSNISSYENGTVILTKNQVLDKEITIKTSGEGNLYYFWEKEGIILKGDYVQEDKNIRVRRTYLDKKGNKITGKVKQNQLVVVRIEVISTSVDVIENVVITDMLPAGLEIENPRLGGAQQFDWIKDASSPEHFDFRDDRVNIFTDVTKKKTQYYYYQTRAVSEGTYKVGVISADAMYDASYHSYHGVGTLVVE
ncbi:large extracellular alpha-helical protein [Bernardetia litoralis DSM 6794]|uniref:Large extracellular alpha-helical protein n=1 Tax=Bernardetia litoralis (strain ATCC 23117 / DSM 6794 / NBRC 15988 / NCIMB 1366 / Fx l1 / Sio-4) TaxID=880071 RepID=I4ANS2_BERLS|nr:MG2 domain-containing protein [Bernardetia litoralis]AFM05607.1 large extracellular alpha-helical protein [Bernardetia litoralis DSM 6794]